LGTIKQSNISSKDKEKKIKKINQKEIGLCLPAAPVTSTLTGSFSFSPFRKLDMYLISFDMYLISFQKKEMENKTTRPF